jgi:hypothetical protein
MAASRYIQPGCPTIDRITGILAVAIASVFLTAGPLIAGEANTSPSAKKMSQDELIKLALSAAPAHVAKEAAVMVQGEDGKLVEVGKGTNGFTCVPMADPNVPTLDPMCMDQAALQRLTSLMNQEPGPANTTPGITFMAKGAHGWVKEGKLLQKKEQGAKLVHFPPHWMISWPFDSKTSGFPDCARAPEKFARSGNTCVAEDGTPSDFLVIYQDPVKLKFK